MKIIFSAMSYQRFYSFAVICLLLMPSIFSNLNEDCANKINENFIEPSDISGNPDSLSIEGLRVLASTNSISFETIDHQGVNEFLTHLHHEANKLVDSVYSKTQNDFTVFDYSMYPLLVYQNELEGSDNAFNAMVNLVESGYNSTYYLLIGRQYSPHDNSVEFRVEMKLPVIGELEGLDQSFQESFKEIVLTTLTDAYSTSFNAPEATEAGIIALQNLVNNFASFSSGTPNEDLLSLLGFEEMPCDLSELEETGTKSLTSNVKNYAGLSIDNIAINGEIESVLSSADITSFGLSVTTIITDGQNYTQNSSENDWSSADSEFHSSQTQVVIWYHYLAPVSPEGSRKLFWKMKSNLSQQEALGLFENMWLSYLNELHDEEIVTLQNGGQTNRSVNGDCPCLLSCLNKWTAKKNLMPCLELELSGLDFFGNVPVDGINFAVGFYSGLIDGLLETVYFLASSGFQVFKISQNTILGDVILGTNPATATFYSGVKFISILRKAIFDDTYETWEWSGETTSKKFSNTVSLFKDGIQFLTTLVQNWDTILVQIKNGLSQWLDNIVGRNGSQLQGYEVGKIVFELLIGIATGGTSLAVSVTEQGALRMKTLLNALKEVNLNNVFAGFWQRINNKSAGFKCKILYGGCFSSGTPVFLATRRNLNKIGTLTLAGALPITATPIQNVQLLDYAVAHETVNSTYDISASTDLAIHLNCADNDPFTSPQQRQRDQYKLDDTNWHEVIFEQVHGTSTAKLALHTDWITQNNYQLDAIVNMNLPEQGISGPFRITSIKRLLPQKRPEDEEAGKGFVFRPVTGIFIHESNDVWTLEFDSGDTANHPIYSTTAQDWRLAGELAPGEQVLTHTGSATLTGKRPAPAQRVYNLEVRGVHNFLVAEVGVVVHNSCIEALLKLYDDFIDSKGLKHILRGEINGAGKATGVHSISAVDLGTARQVGTKIDGPNGLYKVKVEVKDAHGNWIAKISNDGYSTFFPDDWNQIKVMENIAHAHHTASKVPGTSNTYYGFSIDGSIEIRMFLKSDGTVISAFPKF
jgi:hypothetical protein